MTPTFPTKYHAEAAQVVADFVASLDHVDTILVVNSCARGVAAADSDLDMAVLVTPPTDVAELELRWMAHADQNPKVTAFRGRSPYSAIHLDFFDGSFTPLVWDDGGGPDDFEIEIGNRIAYAAPLSESGPLLKDLQQRWLPYYDEELRLARLSMAREGLLHDLDHIPFYVSRQLYLQAFDRLYKALREYLQALFISHRTYPIAYNKWLLQQLGMIHREELYELILSVLTISDLKSEIVVKADTLKELESTLPGSGT